MYEIPRYIENKVSYYDTLLKKMDVSDEYYEQEDLIPFINIYSKNNNYIGLKNRELVNLIKKGKVTTIELKEIKNALLISNIKLINWVIRTFFYDLNSYIDDFRSLGLSGLWYSIENFDYENYHIFSLYAARCIFHKIKEGFKPVVGITYVDYIRRDELNFYKSELLKYSCGKHNFSDEELSILLGISTDIIDVIESENLTVEYEEFDDETYEAEQEDIEFNFFINMLKDDIRRILSNREYDSLLYEFGFLTEHSSREELAKKYHVSRETIRTDAKKALKKIRDEYEIYGMSGIPNDGFYIKINELYNEYQDYDKVLEKLREEYKGSTKRQLQTKLGGYKKIIELVKSTNYSYQQIIQEVYVRRSEILSGDFVKKIIIENRKK